MILWVLLFVLVVAISFVLALKSMADYQEIPTNTGEEYGLFLIRRPHELNRELMSFIHQNLFNSDLMISFERLIKGTKAALVVYGPKKVLNSYKYTLDLLELEDYTNIDSKYISAWEVAVKKADKPDFSPLSPQDQVWWQLILSAKKDGFFSSHLRLVVVSEDSRKRWIHKKLLQNLSEDKFTKLPKAFPDVQMLDYYRKRGFRKDNKNRNLNHEEVIRLLHV